MTNTEKYEFPIAINCFNPNDTCNPGEVVYSKMEIKNGFLDMYHTDPGSGRNTRISISKFIIEKLFENYRPGK